MGMNLDTQGRNRGWRCARLLKVPEWPPFALRSAFTLREWGRRKGYPSKREGVGKVKGSSKATRKQNPAPTKGVAIGYQHHRGQTQAIYSFLFV